MSKLILMMLLSVVSGSAFSEWFHVATSHDDNVSVYADAATIRKNNNLVKMWHLYDFKKMANGKIGEIYSLRGQSVFDCKDEATRLVTSTAFSDNFAKGKILSNNDNNLDWSPIAPGSMGEYLWKFACGVQ